MTLAYLRGKLAALARYSVKAAFESGASAGDLNGTEYGPRYLEKRPDDPKRVTDQVGMLFDNFKGIDPDSSFPMPGVTNQR